MRHVLLAAAAAFILSAPAFAQEAQPLTEADRREFVALVRDYLDDVQEHFAPGLSAAPGYGDEIVPMAPRADHRWRIDLVAGVPYRIIGACDNECSDLDIELIDAHSGEVVASDTLPDDYPIVDHIPPASGPYDVRLIMQTCSIAPCFGGARVLTGGGLSVRAVSAARSGG
jgi:hypothetical protein